MIRPTTRQTTDEWARTNREYPETASLPGPRDVSITPYILPIQKAATERLYRRIVFVTGTQMSKALDLDTPLPTPSGWTTMGKVQAGDVLFDDRGNPCRVVGVSPIMVGNTCYRVEFCDGTSIVADAGHLWTVDRAYRSEAGIERRSETLTTDQMVRIGVSRSTGAARFSIPLSAPLSLVSADLPVDPYILGAWLGDGNSRCSAISVGDQDVSDMRASFEARGVGTTCVREKTANRLFFFGLNQNGERAGTRCEANMTRRLRLLGLYANKHIPATYLRASESDRWSLLRGLMDTDGTPGGGTCRYVSVLLELAKDVFELAASLGLRPRMKTRAVNSGVYHCVEFRAYRDQPVFGLSRKQEKLPVEGSSSRRHLNLQRYIRAIVPVETRPVRCIGVSSASQLFLAGEAMVPTHNTDGMLDIAGHRMDTAPVPMAFVMPSKELLLESIEPRIQEMIEGSPSLKRKLSRRRSRKAVKTIAGTMIRLIPAGSPTPLSSQPFGLVFTDEVDKYAGALKNQGAVVGLADRRGDSYKDFLHISSSSPSEGPSETRYDEQSELHFWADQDVDNLNSQIWRMWQVGSKHHWAWPCPHCSNYFIPRFRDLKWEKPVDANGKALPSSAMLARRTAHFVCEFCHEQIFEDDMVEGTTLTNKEWMNKRGVYVAPGQAVMNDGTVNGPEPDEWTLSFWVSGLASPFVPWGQRAAEYIEKVRLGDIEEVRTVVNGMGELFSPGQGDAPDWAELNKLRREFDVPEGTVLPEWVRVLALTVDVQKDRLYYVIRGYGKQDTSILVSYGEILGDTADQEVWTSLATLLTTPIDGLPIRIALIDSGYRPGKKFVQPDHMVYRFCRRFPTMAFATKGASNPMKKPILMNKIDIRIDGKSFKKGLELRTLDTAVFKRDLQNKLRWPENAVGSWWIGQGTEDDYLEQMVSEVEVKLSNGRTKWVARSKNNHYFDCFDPETELLTEDGWLPVAEAVSYQGKFASVDLSTDRLEYQHATNSVSRHHDGEMVKIKGRSVDLMVTPNHRMVVDRTNPVDETARIVLAKDISVWHRLKRSSVWIGDDSDTVHLDAVRHRTAVGRLMDEDARDFDSGDWFELLGWIVSEGHSREIGASQSVVITQNPGPKSDRIAALLTRMGIEFRMVGGRQYVITSRQIFSAVSDCCAPGGGRGCYRKRVPAMVRAASPRLIERFIESAVLGDGWSTGNMRAYATVSKELADGIQELFLKIGRGANVTVRPAKDWSISGRSGVSVDQYHVAENRGTPALLRKSDNSPLFKTVPYSGMVYCVTVPNGTLIARRNGKAIVVGNCESMQRAVVMMLNLKLLSGAAPRRALPSTTSPRKAADRVEEASERRIIAEENPPAGRAPRRRAKRKASIW